MSQKLKKTVVYAFMILLLLICMIPLIWVVRTAFIPQNLALDLKAIAIPTLDNFKRVLGAAPFDTYYMNTLIIVLGVLMVQFVLITLAGYAFARIDFYGSKVLFVIFLSQMMIAPEVLILPNYSMMAGWGLTDTRIGIMLPFFASAMGTLIVRQTVKTIPYELEEAAKVDGAHLFQILHDLPAEESQKKWKRIANSIEQECEKKKIDVAAVTGDFTYHASREEFDRVECFLEDVIGRLRLTRQQVLMCPGNHDADTGEAGSTFSHYQEFVERFYGGHFPLNHKKVNARTKYVFISMNTCRETSLELYERATFLEEECEKVLGLSDGEKGILLIHHPPETIGNQELLEKIMESQKACLILSGHQHMSQPRVYKAGGITVVGGMAVSPHRRWMAAGCQIVMIKSNGNVKTKRIEL